MRRPEILLMRSLIERTQQTLEATYEVHRYDTAPDRDALIHAIAPRVMAIATRGDYPLPGSRDTGPRKDAVTDYQRLGVVEVPIALGRYESQRYSLVLASPRTGRFRQIRKHFAHIHHPIIGDSQHGRGDHNRLFKQYFASHRLLLHALELEFNHPLSGKRMVVKATLDGTWMALMERFGWPLRG